MIIGKDHMGGKVMGNLRGPPNVPVSSPQSERNTTTSARAVVIRASVRLNDEAPRNSQERVVAQSGFEKGLGDRWATASERFNTGSIYAQVFRFINRFSKGGSGTIRVVKPPGGTEVDFWKLHVVREV